VGDLINPRRYHRALNRLCNMLAVLVREEGITYRNS
jgi:hypothetical protein